MTEPAKVFGNVHVGTVDYDRERKKMSEERELLKDILDLLIRMGHEDLVAAIDAWIEVGMDEALAALTVDQRLVLQAAAIQDWRAANEKWSNNMDALNRLLMSLVHLLIVAGAESLAKRVG